MAVDKQCDSDHIFTFIVKIEALGYNESKYNSPE